MKRPLLLLLLIIVHQCLHAQSVGIGTNTPDSSAALEINSSNKGLLLPRVSDTSSVKKPVKGLFIFNNNDNMPWYFDGSQWQKAGPGEVNATAAPGPGMDSLWYRVQDSIVYTYYPYVHINTNPGFIAPQATLQAAGNLLIQGKLNHSNATPTPAQTYTMTNTATLQTIPGVDSVFRIYDPGGTANYNNNMQGNISASLAYKQVGIKVSSVAADFGLGTGDTLWIAYDVFPACRTNYAYCFANTTVNPTDFIVGAYDGAIVYFIFRSNGDGTNGKGFNFLATRLFNSEKYKKIHAAGPALYFNSTNGAFAAGYNADVLSTNGTALGSFTRASGVNATAMGYFTRASASYATGMGYATTASGISSTAIGNYTTASGQYSTAMGNNTTASGDNSTAMGATTIASGNKSTAMGSGTTANGNNSVAMGLNTSASGDNSTAMGSFTIASGNTSIAMGSSTTASGVYSTAMGYGTTASGLHSMAMGYTTIASGVQSTAMGNYVSTNGHSGSFVIGDNSTTTILYAANTNNFRARFAGGYRLFTSANLSTGCTLFAGDNAWTTGSDVNSKENFAEVNGEDFLQKIAGFHLTSWNYKKQDPKTFRHYGPMAQDFHAAFGKDKYGSIGNDTTINSADFAGISLIAIQALEKRTAVQQQQLEQTTNALKKEITEMNRVILQLKKEIDGLKQARE
ncbi:MAG: tail fiber domain-containing protein [Chitinophagaceae bacterium]